MRTRQLAKGSASHAEPHKAGAGRIKDRYLNTMRFEMGLGVLAEEQPGGEFAVGEPAGELVEARVFLWLGDVEAPAMRRAEVYITGAGNSTGRAAIYLARYAASVTLMVRGDPLAKSMSDHLVREIDSIPNIAVRLQTEVAPARGERRLERLLLRDRRSGDKELVDAAALFVMTGSTLTGWLPDSSLQDDREFIRTGSDALADTHGPASWPLD